jgi:hypothetical protein
MLQRFKGWIGTSTKKIEDLDAALLQHRLMWPAGSSTNSAAVRTKLRPRHIPRFESISAHTSLFNEFGKTLCEAQCVSKKELFENWACAVRIHQVFAHRRIADIAGGVRRVVVESFFLLIVLFIFGLAGHGLLGWSLLLLDLNSGKAKQPLTVVCIDQRMPESADEISRVMSVRWPELGPRFQYIEGSVMEVQAAPSVCSRTWFFGSSIMSRANVGYVYECVFV